MEKLHDDLKHKHENTNDFVSACPMCGSYAVSWLAQPPALLAICDVLVVKFLEALGKRLVRVERSRFNKLGNNPWYVAHTIWQADQKMIEKLLPTAWDEVPALLTSYGCCNVTSIQVTTMLDEYVTDLLITRSPHNLEDLKYRFESRLNIELPASPDPYSPKSKSE